MTGGMPLWIAEGDVVAVLDMADAIGALEEGLQAEASGAAQNMLKTHLAWADGDTLHAIGAAWPASGFAGAKTWVHSRRGATPLLILFDTESGALRAVIEAFALGQLRTGAVCGVATGRLARAAANTLAIIGTGNQALPQVAAVAAVRPLERVTVFSPNPDHRVACAARITDELGLPARATGSVAEAVAGASIVTLVTRATQPFLSPSMVAPGTHINAVGAIVPQRQEFEPTLLARCTAVVVDSVPQAQRLSREFMEYFAGGGWEAVEPLSALVARDGGRPPDADLTLFKTMGIGMSDLALATCCYGRAVERGLGRPLPQPRHVDLRYGIRDTISITGGKER